MSQTQAKTRRKKNRKPAARQSVPRKRKRPPGLSELAIAALEDMKAVNIKVLDVRNLTDITDTMIVATGTSDRHVRSIAGRVVERCKAAGFQPMGVEGERDGEWVLVDLRDVLVHVMLPRIREFYGLEKLWDVRPPREAAHA
jgi:ribosome-associated protein